MNCKSIKKIWCDNDKYLTVLIYTIRLHVFIVSTCAYIYNCIDIYLIITVLALSMNNIINKFIFYLNRNYIYTCIYA